MPTNMWASLAAAVLASLASQASAQNAPQDFNIGIVASLTGPFNGPAKDTIDGFDAWVKGRGLPGKKIVLNMLDDETNPVSASNAFRKLAGDPKTNIIFLNINSSSALAAKAFASEFKVPIITGGGADALGFPPDPWMFKVAPSGHDAMTVVLQYMQKKGMKKIAHLYGTDAYGQYDDKAIVDLAPKFGVTLVAAESFAIEDTNFNAQLTKIRAANPDLIYSSAAGRAAILVFKQFKQFGITTPLVVSQAAPTASFYDAIGGPKVADGLLLPTQRGVFGTAAGGDTARLYEELKKSLGRTPTFFMIFGFDAGLIMEAAVKNSDGSRQGIRGALEKLKDLPAVNGPVTYTAQDHTGQDFRSLAIGRLENGVAVPAE
jgi:branched-chain amino acid transport system substrate-binding protein